MSTPLPGVLAPDPVVAARYAAERAKRIRPDGPTQFVQLSSSETFSKLYADPWADHAKLNAQEPALKDGEHTKFLVLGAGWGGLIFAVRLIQAGFSKDDLRFVDEAAGFGGTWYWNRYPGLMCDTESYLYLPLLDDTEYMPKHRYSYGEEIRAYAEGIADKWGLNGTALWRTRYTKLEWDSEAKRWNVFLTTSRGPDAQPVTSQITAQFVWSAAGVLSAPQVPRLPGLETFKNPSFHSSRWDYSVSGGSPVKPESGVWDLPGLKGKRVGIVGTGATAVQIVPQLAKNAGHLYVFQRTPSSVDERNQRETDPEEWKTRIAAEKGWQAKRVDAFHKVMNKSTEPLGEQYADLVSDGWAKATAYNAILGGESTLAGPGLVNPTMEGIGAHVMALQQQDFARSESIRARVDEVVTNKETAERLKHFYPVWCKRPAFHDEYLPSFNLPNVTLVDTDGNGVQRVTETGLVVADVEYPIDILILATGFSSPSEGGGNPAVRAHTTIIGRDGKSLLDVWNAEGAGTLHGVSSHAFPNLWFPGSAQSGTSPNFTAALDQLASHVAYVLKTAHERVEPAARPTLVIEVSKEAQDAWAMQTLMRAAWFSAISGCTPGYLNNQAAVDLGEMTPENMGKSARSAPWAEGIRSFGKILEGWRADGKLGGYLVA